MTDIIPKSVDQLNQSNLGDKKLSREEIWYLRNQEQLWYSNVWEKLFQDIIETNKRLLSSDKVLWSFIDEILSNPTTMKQIAYKAWIKLWSKQLALLWDDAPEKKYEKYSILVHMLLIWCNAMPEVKTNLVNNINNLLYTESTIKSLHRFQKQWAKMNGWSKADCLIGKKTMQQMLAKMGIQGVRTKVDSKFASSNITAKNNYERNGEQQKQMDKIINDPILSDAEKTKKLLEVAKKTVTKGTDGLDKKYGAVSYMLTRISDKLMRDRSEEEVQVIIDTLKWDPEGLQLIKKYWNENSAKQFGANPTLIKKTNNWIADLNERKEIVIDKRKNVKAMIGWYKSYLEKLSQDYKWFDWATDVDEKLQVHVKKIDKLLYEINNTNLYQDDALLAKAFINIMNDPHSQKILNDPMTKIFIKDKTQWSYQYEYYLTYNEMQKLISNPSWWWEEWKTKFVQLLRRMDKYDDSTLLLSSYESSEATKDLSKDAVDKSMTNNEDTKNKLKEMNDLFTSDKEGNYTPAFEKLVSYIDQGNEDEARKFIKEQIQWISTDDHRYPNFIWWNDYIDDLMDSVKSLNETEKETKKDIESWLEEEIQKLIKMEENGTLNRQWTEQLVKLREAKGNKTLNILIDDSYKQIKYAMISSSIGHELRSQMLDKYPSLFTAWSGSLVDSYANVVWAGDYLSDKTVESIQSTTVQIIIQVILAIFSFGIANAVEATLAWSIARFAGKEVATTLAKNLIYKSAMLLTKWLVYTATTAAGNAVMQAKDIGEIGTIWQKWMSLENILGNTAMIGILWTLKNISMIGKALKTGEITGKTWFLIKNWIGKFISKWLSNNIARVWVEEISINLSQWASKIIFGDGNYTTQDFLEASAQGLAFELIPWVGEIKFRKDKKNSMNVTTMVNGKVYEWHPDKILNDIKNDHPWHQINSNGSNWNNVLKGDLNSTKK